MWAQGQIGQTNEPRTLDWDLRQYQLCRRGMDANHLNCRLGIWSAETCLRFGFTVKIAIAIEFFAKALEQCSQSGIVP
jgi:hypothetical protein